MKTSTFARIGSGVVGLALLASTVPAFADTSTTTATTTPGSYNVACVQTAVGVHEDAKIAATNTFNAAKGAAMVTFKADIIAAWGQTDFSLRFTALKAAFSKLRAVDAAARTAEKTALATSNTTFQASMKACGVTKADITGNATSTANTKKNKDNDGDTDSHMGKGLDLGLHLGGSMGLHLGKKDK